MLRPYAGGFFTKESQQTVRESSLFTLKIGSVFRKLYRWNEIPPYEYIFILRGADWSARGFNLNLKFFHPLVPPFLFSHLLLFYIKIIIFLN
jgi:hypothetical protein